MKKSAGIVLYKTAGKHLEIFLVHPGGPFWKNKDLGAWSIPKGEFNDEEPLEAAIREFKEETGHEINGAFVALTPVKQKSGKWVYGFALEKYIDPESITSNTFDMEWPPKSGKLKSFPEIDRAAWFTADVAIEKIVKAQAPMIEELKALVGQQ